jgi:hypothetical protein
MYSNTQAEYGLIRCFPTISAQVFTAICIDDVRIDCTVDVPQHKCGCFGCYKFHIDCPQHSRWKRGFRPVAREVQLGGQYPLWICTMSKTNILISPLKTCDTLPYLRVTSAEMGVIGNKGNTFTNLISFWPSWPCKGGVDINNDVTWRQTHWGWPGCQLALCTSTNKLGLHSKWITVDECNL